MRRLISTIAATALTLVLMAGPAIAGSSWYMPVRRR